MSMKTSAIAIVMMSAFVVSTAFAATPAKAPVKHPAKVATHKAVAHKAVAHKAPVKKATAKKGY